uniref:Ricin B lectin domain-containing protein n=1 Tax=Chaetoceros debilis TaxID=122233 RepID=A0A7S3PZ33_9STRA|mmetsp:Transcript_9831/g.14764  ORF Transcript_9831/g.14764 Transcript_9831/m.14764 type:complete len:417 (-) Transcript_9831:87-1337(-)|eukprot:CAMPEP_0194084702 /NCGR_PEP_ID=MMETSP0149-20130528/14546_1 /TAXON_ID=122233 /ORGANISM="Chaetoceros debilis, Strain MM31A-1" /LENGTH=416 /DNA_ID=CAMNT_0038767431 /DNA_START=10 /DNA_END=1260 /DNA_ORIENTATION=+
MKVLDNGAISLALALALALFPSQTLGKDVGRATATNAFDKVGEASSKNKRHFRRRLKKISNDKKIGDDDEEEFEAEEPDEEDPRGDEEESEVEKSDLSYEGSGDKHAISDDNDNANATTEGEDDDRKDDNGENGDAVEEKDGEDVDGEDVDGGGKDVDVDGEDVVAEDGEDGNAEDGEDTDKDNGDSGDNGKKHDNPVGWYDSQGPEYNCEWYAKNSNCDLFGGEYEFLSNTIHFRNFGMVAKEACVVCGGGRRSTHGQEAYSGAAGKPFRIVNVNLQEQLQTGSCDDGSDIISRKFEAGKVFNKSKELWTWTKDGQLNNIRCNKVLDVGAMCKTDSPLQIVGEGGHVGRQDEWRKWEVGPGGFIQSRFCHGYMLDFKSGWPTLSLLNAKEDRSTNQVWKFIDDKAPKHEKSTATW